MAMEIEMVMVMEMAMEMVSPFGHSCVASLNGDDRNVPQTDHHDRVSWANRQ